MSAYPSPLAGRLLIARGEGGMNAVIRNTLSNFTLLCRTPHGAAQRAELTPTGNHRQPSGPSVNVASEYCRAGALKKRGLTSAQSRPPGVP